MVKKKKPKEPNSVVLTELCPFHEEVEMDEYDDDRSKYIIRVCSICA